MKQPSKLGNRARSKHELFLYLVAKIKDKVTTIVSDSKLDFGSKHIKKVGAVEAYTTHIQNFTISFVIV